MIYFISKRQHQVLIQQQVELNNLKHKLQAIENIFNAYYNALNQRQNGYIAQNTAFNAIEQTLGLVYRPLRKVQ